MDQPRDGPHQNRSELETGLGWRLFASAERYLGIEEPNGCPIRLMTSVWTSGQTKGDLRDEKRRLLTTEVMIVK
jgi:hypothetical protein